MHFLCLPVYHLPRIYLFTLFTCLLCLYSTFFYYLCKMKTKNMQYCCLISGGVDSSVVVHQMCEMGLKPDLFYIQIGGGCDGLSDCSMDDDIEIS